MNNSIHKELASGRWQNLTLPEQLANIGSEVNRSIKWYRKKDNVSFDKAFERALELFDLTLTDERWRDRLKEITRSRELFCSFFYESKKHTDLENEMDSMNNYFLQFGIYVSLNKEKV